MTRNTEERDSGREGAGDARSTGQATATRQNTGGHAGRDASPAAWVGYAVALLGTAAVLVVRLLLDPLMGDEGALLGFAVSVALAAWYGGRGPGLLATVAGLLAGWYYVVRPFFSLRIDRREDAYHLGLFVAVGLLTTWIGDRERTARRQVEADREKEARLLAEQERLVAELRAAGLRQRRFLKEMLAGFTEGRLRLCFSEAELPTPLPPLSEPLELSDAGLRPLRKRLGAVAEGLGMPKDRLQGFATAVHEATVNALKYGEGGTARVHGDAASGTLQVWVKDQGPGIAEEMIHRAVEQGYTTQGFGHGMFFMQSCADRLFLLSEAGRGTTVVLEMDRTAPEPAWLRAGD